VTPWRPVFVDPATDERFRTDGYVVVDLRDQLDPQALLRRWREIDAGGSEGFHAGLVGHRTSYKSAAWHAVSDALAPPAGRLLTGFRPVIGSFIVKRPDPESAMRVHQDWCLVDERRWTSVSVWCPLVDLDGSNGALAVIPGSHHLTVARGIGIPHSCRRIIDAPDDAFTELHLRAGEAVIYSHALVHRSASNRSDQTRVAAMLGMVPSAATPVLYQTAADDPGEVELIEVDTDLLLDFGFGTARAPEGARVIDRLRADAGVGPDDLP
jgi:hypothetical protein